MSEDLKYYYILKDEDGRSFLVEERGGNPVHYGDFFLVATRKRPRGAWYKSPKPRRMKYWTFANRMTVELNESDAIALLLMAKDEKYDF